MGEKMIDRELDTATIEVIQAEIDHTKTELARLREMGEDVKKLQVMMLDIPRFEADILALERVLSIITSGVSESVNDAERGQ